MPAYVNSKQSLFSSSTFILLSNTGGREITKKVYDFWLKGQHRQEIAYVDLEDLIAKGAFNEQVRFLYLVLLH